MSRISVACLTLSLFIIHNIQAQTDAYSDSSTGYLAHRLFSQNFYPDNGNRIRAANGAPGPDYWQNEADYKIEASLDTTTHLLSGKVDIHYTNNSPDSLQSLWLQLDENRYQGLSRSDFVGGLNARGTTSGYRFNGIPEVTSNDKNITDSYLIDDTRLQIKLNRKLAPSGGTCEIHISYSYEVPGSFGGRTRWIKTPHGTIFDIAQWYPRMCVYDDLHGWNTLPFLGEGEFYCEYGNFDYKITVPWNMIVAGSGELQNPKAVLTSNQITRLAKARTGGGLETIISKTEIQSPKSRPVQKGTLTWHFKMNHSRDVSFAASTAFMWDAEAAELPGGRKVLAMSVYPPESSGQDAWGRATDYLKASIEYFSKNYAPYPWNNATNVGGPVGGMEYPGIIFVSKQVKGKQLYDITAHEIGHNWFPMLVGSNERRYAWMDEGMNTFIDIGAMAAYNNGEYAPKRDGEYAPGGGNPADEIIPYLKDPFAPIIMDRADAVSGNYTHPFFYFKTAFGLHLLRDVILGPSKFDYAFRTYVKNWSFKHPSPYDFFRTIENESGEDLGWFWKEWFFHNWEFDEGITEVEYKNLDPKQGTKVTIKNYDQMALPTEIQWTTASGQTGNLKIPIEVWLQGDTYTITLPTKEKMKSIILDPDNLLPDSRRSNNLWMADSK